MATEWRGYFFIESIDLTAAQRQTLVAALRAWGLHNESIYPNYRNHWRIRPDQLAVIYEAVFDADIMTAAWMKAKLAEIFGVAASSVSYATTTTAYGPLVTYKYLTVNKLRMGIFGGLSATWEQSWAAVQAYLSANLATWETPIA